MATTPTPQNNSNDPQVPGSFPGTVQNPTQVPAPVNPAVDPEVSPPPNDVDPNYIPNPAPVNPASDPEVPPATTEFGGGKRFDAEPVVPATNQQVPPAQDLGSEPPIDLPQAPPSTIDPQIPQPDSFPEEGIDRPQALPPAEPAANNTGFDDFYGDQTYTANRTGTADAPPVTPTASNTGFDDFYGDQTYTTNYTGTADSVPPANTGFDDFYGEQTYTANFTGTADARPVTPTTNSQVPQAPIQNIFDLIANLFSRTPTTVAPTVNPQVAQAIPVPTPAAIVAVPIPPVSNPQVPTAPVVRTTTVSTTTVSNNPGFDDFYGEQTYTANRTGTADAPPVTPTPANTGFDDYYGEQTYTTNYTGTADSVPPANTGFDDFYGEQTYTATGTGTADTVAPANTGFDDFYGEQTYTATGTGTADTVAPATDASVPQSNTRIDGPVDQSTFQQANPTAANDYRSYVVDTQNKIVEQQTRELEASQGFPASENQIAVINGQAFGTATVAADIKFKDQIQAADAAQSVPAGTPPPTVAPAAAEGFGPPPNDADPNFISNPGPVDTTIDPEVPQPTAEFGGGKRFAPEAVDEFGPPPNDVDPNYIPNAAPVVSTVNPQVPAAQDLGSEPPIDLPQAPPSTVDPQVPAAQDLGSEPPIDLPQAPPAGVDPQIPQPDSFPEEGIDLPAPVQSPTPYERFLAEENAGADAAQAAATARFNAQFDDGGNIIGSADDPQVNQGDVTDVGEFQAEPVDIPNIDTGYDDFYGNDEVNDVGEFQAEPVDIPNIDTGYDDFYGNDTGEFQDLSLEPAAGDGESASFSNFFDSGGGGGDFLGGLFGGSKSSAKAVSGRSDPFAGIVDGLFGDGPTKPNPKTTVSPQQAAANRANAAKEQAKQQNIINQQRKQANDGDWRVRLRLAGNSNYLYNAEQPGILQPLKVTAGVIFPYTPAITTAYQAKYNAYELTHSNYKGYFYQGSSVGDISINATFTAQDTDEANYLLAVIHFFRSVTKMFYGQDDSAKRGAPPPLVFLQGLGEYQFNLHPCVVSNFNYTLPAEVDYIRALSPNNSGTNLIDRRSLQSGVTPFVNPSVSRLRNAGLPQGGISTPPAPPTLGTNSPTYVPTKMDIQLTLLAIQTRSQVSKEFSLKEFANGNLIKGGFW
jgi:hypothetical protein